jgi:hypothetical protein
MWDGAWSQDRKTFKGTYTFPDGGMFDGEAVLSDMHRVEIKIADGFSKISEHPCEPYWTFTGTWRAKDGSGYAPHKPPPPEADDAEHSA